MSVSVRIAEARDKQACLEIISTLTGREPDERWSATFDKLVTGKRGAILIAEVDGKPLGVATISYNLAIRYGGEYCQLEELIVNEAARGKNAGAALMKAAVSSARDRGCAEMGLYLVEWSEGNRPFYERFGFEVVGTEMRQSLR
jgi:GNAT superfamily N-acetyltransferase